MAEWGVLTYYCAFTLVLIAYLLGSIPSAVWIGKKYYGIDIREHGSKNAGTTNMLRVLGKKAAIPVFIIDYFKGFIAVQLTFIMKFDDAVSPAWLINLRLIATAAVVLGHIFPIFADFKGGKGVATLLGAGTGIYLDIGVKQNDIVCIYSVQSAVVATCKAVILIQQNRSKLWIVHSEPHQRVVRRAIIGHYDLGIGRMPYNTSKVAFQ